MKIKKSDFTRICSTQEMLPGEIGILLDVGENTLVVRAEKRVIWNGCQESELVMGISTAYCWFTTKTQRVGVLPPLPTFTIEED